MISPAVTARNCGIFTSMEEGATPIPLITVGKNIARMTCTKEKRIFNSIRISQRRIPLRSAQTRSAASPRTMTLPARASRVKESAATRLSSAVCSRKKPATVSREGNNPGTARYQRLFSA